MFLNFCSAVWGAVGAAACELDCAESALAFAASDCACVPSAGDNRPALIQIAPRTRADQTFAFMLSPGLTCRPLFSTTTAAVSSGRTTRSSRRLDPLEILAEPIISGPKR